jgi:hypothetical protein
MMSSEVTGQVRARLGGEFQPATSERSGGLLAASKQQDDGWSTPQVGKDLIATGGAAVVPQEEAASSSQQEMISDEEAVDWVDDHSPEAVTEAPQSQNVNSDHFKVESPAMLQADVELSNKQVASPIRILKRGGDEVQPAPVRPPDEDLDASDEPNVSQREYLETLEDEVVAFEEVDGMSGDLITWKTKTTLVGFLITYDNNKTGDYVELRTGRLMVTSEFESAGNCLVVAHPSVSPMHAIMRVGTSGTVQVLDQLSEHGTRVRHVGIEEEEFLSGEKGTLSHGDVVYFGDRAFHVCLITPPFE